MSCELQKSMMKISHKDKHKGAYLMRPDTIRYVAMGGADKVGKKVNEKNPLPKPADLSKRTAFPQHVSTFW